MSFGKSFSWNKKVVDDAVKYAVSKDVLLVHAAGNDAENNDTSPNFPNDKYAKSGWFSPKKAKTWMEVGALSWKGGESAAASFSNYGKENVDIFAPGTAIYNTVPGNEYRNLQGTSMAAPVVAGVAAMLRSHFPELTAEQVKEIMMNSTEKQSQKVKKPGTKDMVPFTDLCISGGVVNAFKAVELASKTPGKKKVKSGGMDSNGGAAGTAKPAKAGA
jgi:subtilisin family serine protease